MLAFSEYLVYEEGFNWLDGRGGGWQFGEQGFLLALIAEYERKTDSVMFPRVAVEIGGGDGTELPLTLEPLVNDGWHVIAYESDMESRFGLFDKFSGQVVVREDFTDGVELRHDQPQVVVLDVDGMECCFMESVLNNSTPKVLMVEHYDFAGPKMESVGERDDQACKPPPKWLLGMPTGNNFRIQARAECLDEIAKRFGYVPAVRTRINTIYLSAATAKELQNV